MGFPHVFSTVYAGTTPLLASLKMFLWLVARIVCQFIKKKMLPVEGKSYILEVIFVEIWPLPGPKIFLWRFMPVSIALEGEGVPP